MNRRTLIIKASSTTLLGCSTIPHSGLDTSPIDPSDETCVKTLTQMEGPYYHSTLTDTIDMTEGATEGIVTLHGQLTDTKCQSIAQAKIDIWHANQEGEYDLSSGERIHYGFVITDENGMFTMRTILPGAYLNGPNTYRPRHYHIKIWVQEVELLTTQLYFVGDEFLQYEPDTPQALMLTLEEVENGWESAYTFVIED